VWGKVSARETFKPSTPEVSSNQNGVIGARVGAQPLYGNYQTNYRVSVTPYRYATRTRWRAVDGFESSVQLPGVGVSLSG